MSLADFENRDSKWVRYDELPLAEQEERWFNYLEKLPSLESSISERQIEDVRALWGRLRKDLPDLPTPRTGPSPEGSIVIAWRSKQYYLDFEVWKDGTFEWFQKDFDTNDYDGEEALQFDGDLPEKVITLLRNLVDGDVGERYETE